MAMRARAKGLWGATARAWSATASARGLTMRWRACHRIRLFGDGGSSATVMRRDLEAPALADCHHAPSRETPSAVTIVR
jgi:hypothetical protein